MSAPDKQLSAEQSAQVAEMIREEIARRRISRQTLAEQAKLSLSTLEKVLGGRRPFTLATMVRLEQALGVSLRKTTPSAAPAAIANGDVAPDSLGAYSRRAVAWLDGTTYVTLRPSFGEKDAIFAYYTRFAWDDATSSLLFHEGERLDAIYSQWGEVAVPNQSGFIYFVTNRHGQHRLITVSRPTRLGEMYGIILTLLAGRGSNLTPIASPIALVPDFARRRQLRRLSRAHAADDGGTVCSARAGVALLLLPACGGAISFEVGVLRTDVS
jgi:transcriptional regulator with XRE-family HTH domain